MKKYLPPAPILFALVSILLGPPVAHVVAEPQADLMMRVFISGILMASGLFVILSKRPQDKHWAYTTIGAVMGFWLNSK
jgi:NhaP-type Na+/H+ or K+/H+ antiporter